MLKGRRLAFFAVVLIGATFIMVSSARPTAAGAAADAEQNGIALVVRPLVIMNYSAIAGQKFSVNITSVGATGLHGYRIGVEYNPSLLQCTAVGEGDFFEGFDFTMSNATDNTAGTVYVSANLTSPNGENNGTLFTLTFQVESQGETALHIYEAFLYDPSETYLSYTAYDGYFNNKFNFDITMPLTLLAVTFVSLFLNPKTESKLKGVFEDKEFQVRDSVLLVGLMVVMITLVVVVRQLEVVLMALFLFSYSLLLFTFGYLLAGKRWYIGILPPAIFILLYVFLRENLVWTYYLSNAYGLIFAVLITLYLATLFTWKTTLVFGALITAMDIVLVLVTKTMVQAASAAMSLSLPVLVSLPLVPLIATGGGLLLLSLGLGDFFFAGLLAIQTYKQYGRSSAIVAIVAMTASFFLFEAFILTSRVGAFPGTLMIICGWVPVVLAQYVRNRRKTEATSSENMVQG